MAYPDFVKEFTDLEICHLNVSCISDAKKNVSWISRVECGSWVKETFWTNPQIRVTVVDADTTDDEDKGQLIVALMQNNRRCLKVIGQAMLPIGYVIYEYPEGMNGLLSRDFFLYHRTFARSPQFINAREVCGRHTLPPGQYVIIPSTFRANDEANFTLRVYSEAECKSE